MCTHYLNKISLGAEENRLKYLNKLNLFGGLFDVNRNKK